jgi:hypothetical protein
MTQREVIIEAIARQLTFAGRRDYRPSKSGRCGRFSGRWGITDSTQ